MFPFLVALFHKAVPGRLDVGFLRVPIGVNEDDAAVGHIRCETLRGIEDSSEGMVAVNYQRIDRAGPDLVLGAACDVDEPGWVFGGEVSDGLLEVDVAGLELLLVLRFRPEWFYREDETGDAEEQGFGPGPAKSPDLKGVC